MGKKKNAKVTDIEATVDLTGSSPELPLRDDVDDDANASVASSDPTTEPSGVVEPATDPEGADAGTSQKHLRGLVEALVFAADQPIRANEIAKLAEAPSRQIKEVLEELKVEYAGRGIQLEEIAGGFAFRTNMAFAPFVRDLVGQKPVKLTRAQLETLAIVAYRQPVTRPEMDDVRGVDCGPVLRTLLERDLIRIMGKKEEAGRPILYGTSAGFLELFGLSSLKDLPTLREFTELNEESKRTVEHELGETMEEKLGGAAPDGDRPTLESMGNVHSHRASAPPKTDEDPPASQEVPADAAPKAEGDEEEDEDDEEWDDEDDEWDDEDDEDEDEKAEE